MVPANEYNSYYKRYIDSVQEKPILDVLEQGLRKTKAYFSGIPAEIHEYRYAAGKWTPKEVLLHIIDTERVFMYRALQFSRANGVVLEGFDQDEFVSNGFANERSMENLLEEYNAVRLATLAFVGGCSPSVFSKMGFANESPLSVRAALYICGGHEIHHINILNERYF